MYILKTKSSWESCTNLAHRSKRRYFLKMIFNLLPLLTITTFEDCVTSILGVVVGSEMKNIIGNYDGNRFQADKVLKDIALSRK